MALDSQALHTDPAGTRYRGRLDSGIPRAAAGSRRRRNHRRRVVVPVSDIDGAEFQLPAVPVVRQARRFLALVLMAGIVLLGNSLLTSPRYTAGMPVVIGVNTLTEVQVSSIAGVRGKSIVLIDTTAVRNRLESYPEIQSARVTLSWPNEVQIKIEERPPVVSWAESGRIWWISADGIAFLGREESVDLPRLVSSGSVLQINEDPLEPVVDPSVVKAVAELTAIVPEVREFTFDAEHGLGFTDPRGWKAYFGRNGDLEQKILVYSAITAQLEDSEQPELVSVEQVTAPYYR